MDRDESFHLVEQIDHLLREGKRIVLSLGQ
jgi:hypothetical protein